jgi:deoxyuridine 5'-triphosphate nucleotidohydrolase
MNTIKYKRLDPKAIVPLRANPTDAGADLFSIEDIELLSMSRVLIKTGLSIEIPEGYYGRIAPRSGLAFKNGIDVLAGVIDSSYRGELCVLLLNAGSNSFSIKSGDRIAQLIIEAHYNMNFEETYELQQSNRGIGGFGSSGV